MEENMDIYLKPTGYIDSGSRPVMDFTGKAIIGISDDIGRAVSVFYAVRDGIRYNPYLISPEKSTLVASNILAKGEGYCVQKAILLAAALRSAGIPCRLGFAIVKNHLTTPRMRELLQGDLFVFHGYNEIHLGGRWIKATPTFDISLCERFGVLPLDFDGTHDSIFHQFDRAGNRHMEYLHDYGTFADLPYDLMISEVTRHYPHLAEQFMKGDWRLEGNFAEEAEQSR